VGCATDRCAMATAAIFLSDVDAHPEPESRIYFPNPGKTENSFCPFGHFDTFAKVPL
jgi:hypothetical protein